MLYQLSYGPLNSNPAPECADCHGQGRNRTADTAVFSRVLYHLSYLARCLFDHPYKANAAHGGVGAK